MEKSGLKPSVPALPFGLGGLGASSQWIFGILGHLQFLHYMLLHSLLHLQFLRLCFSYRFMGLHCWAHVPGCLHTEGTFT